MKDLLNLYKSRKNEIKNRLKEFEEVWDQDDKRIFTELVFCMLTPQSKAESCWRAASKMLETGKLFTGNKKDIQKFLFDVRFPENKSKYIIEAREKFMITGDVRIKDKLNFESKKEAREWVVENVKGLGYKEASHFLRNIGMGSELAILDRHILRNLVTYAVIKEMPKSLTHKNYLEIENKMRHFAWKIGVPFPELDLLLWSKETGKVFK